MVQEGSIFVDDQRCARTAQMHGQEAGEHGRVPSVPSRLHPQEPEASPHREAGGTL